MPEVLLAFRDCVRRPVFERRQFAIRMGASQLVEGSYYGVDVGQIGQKLVGRMLEDLFV